MVNHCSGQTPPCPSGCSRVARSAKRKAHCRVAAAGPTQTVGSRLEVWRGKAHHTSGGLKRSDLMISKSSGRIVSKKASEQAKKAYKRNNLAQYKAPPFRWMGWFNKTNILKSIYLKDLSFSVELKLEENGEAYLRLCSLSTFFLTNLSNYYPLASLTEDVVHNTERTFHIHRWFLGWLLRKFQPIYTNQFYEVYYTTNMMSQSIRLECRRLHRRTDVLFFRVFP